MKIVAFVPLKLNNERLPNKNTNAFDNGKPLVSYILNTLHLVSVIDKVYVYCSQESIKDYLDSDTIYLKRSTNLDLSTTKINEVISAFVNDVDADVYILAHATAPFLSKESVIKGIDAIKEHGHDSALTVQKLQEFIWSASGPINYNPAAIPRTQDLDPYYLETSGLYIFKKSLITEHNRRVGFNPYLIEVSKIEAIDINNAEDFVIANAVYNSMLNKKS